MLLSRLHLLSPLVAAHLPVHVGKGFFTLMVRGMALFGFGVGVGAAGAGAGAGVGAPLEHKA